MLAGTMRSWFSTHVMDTGRNSRAANAVLSKKSADHSPDKLESNRRRQPFQSVAIPCTQQVMGLSVNHGAALAKTWSHFRLGCSKIEFKRKLDRARAADLVERVERLKPPFAPPEPRLFARVCVECPNRGPEFPVNILTGKITPVPIPVQFRDVLPARGLLLLHFGKP